MRNITAIIAASIVLIGCSTAPEKPVEIVDPISTAEPEPTCMDDIIGSAPVRDWCSVLPEAIQKGCDCDSASLPVLLDAFAFAVKHEKSPSDLKAWYATLPPDIATKRTVEWMIAGIPKVEAAKWYDLGYEVGETTALYDLDMTLEQVKRYIDEGMRADEIKAWSETGIPGDLWKVWRSDDIGPEMALKFTQAHDLKRLDDVKVFLLNRRFVRVDSSVRAKSWICSRSNEVAQPRSISENRLNYIQRFRLVDDSGYDLPDMELFEKEYRGKLIHNVRRRSGPTHHWAVCPPNVVNDINELGW